MIDRNHGPNGTIFAVAMTEDAAGGYHQRLHAIDLVKGSELAGSPVEIAGSFPGTGDDSTNGVVAFDPGQYAVRTALLLLNGTIYFGWTSHLDSRPYTGWVMGYDENSLQQTQILNLTPNGDGGAVWMSGNGLSADVAGNVYLLNANGTFDINLDGNGFPASGDFGNTAIKLTSANGKLVVADYFAPHDTVAESDLDHDLGLTGAMLLPDAQDANGKKRHLLIAAGKGGRIYVLDRDQMGKDDPDGGEGNAYQEIDSAFRFGCWASPAFFNGTVYFGPVFEPWRRFRLPMPGWRLRLLRHPRKPMTIPVRFPASPRTEPKTALCGHSRMVQET